MRYFVTVITVLVFSMLGDENTFVAAMNDGGPNHLGIYHTPAGGLSHSGRVQHSAGTLSLTGGTSRGRLLHQASCDSFKAESSDIPNAMLDLGLAIVSELPYLSLFGAFFSFIKSLGDTMANKPSMYTCMTDYVDEQLTIAIAAEQRASFLQRVSLFRGSLENLEDSLRNDTLIYEPKDAWKISEDDAIKAIDYVTNRENIKDNTTFLILFITFITDEYLPFRSFSYHYAGDLGISAKEISTRTYKSVLHDFVGVAGASNGLVKTANRLVQAACDEIMDPKRFVVDIEHRYKQRLLNFWYVVKDTKVGFEADNNIFSETNQFSKTLRHSAERMKAFLVNHAKAAADIHLFQVGPTALPAIIRGIKVATFAAQYWPSMIPGSSNITVEYRSVVHKTKCFSHLVDCKTGKKGGHDAELSWLSKYPGKRSFNMTKLIINAGDHLDYVWASFEGQVNGSSKLKTSYSIGFGNAKGGTAFSFSDLATNPIVKVEWSVADMLKDNLDWYRKYHSDEGTTFLSTINGLVITQNNSKVTKLGWVRSGDKGKTYTDDFSQWQGRVYLCGLSVYGEPNVRIHGMGAHWCHQEVQIKTTLAVTKP